MGFRIMRSTGRSTPKDTNAVGAVGGSAFGNREANVFPVACSLLLGRVALPGIVLLLAGCTALSSTGATGASSASGAASNPSATSAPTSASTAPAATTSFPGITTTPPRGAAGAYLPASAVTPGATNPAVTQATIGSTICRPGYTATIRPPVSYTDALKVTQLAHGYAVGGNHNPAAYEEDHLVSLELGGSPTSIRNLWPEPWEHSAAHPAGFAAPGTGAQTKDRIEDSLRSRVCNGQLTLAAAQHTIAANWWVAFNTYLGSPAVTAPRPTSMPVASGPPKPTSPGLPIVHPGAFCSPPGAPGVTTLGTPMVCKLDSKSLRYRWAHA